MILSVGLKQIDVEMRVSAISFAKRGVLSLPKHNSKFLLREKKIKNLKLKNNELSNEEFLTKISDLLIHKNYYKVVKMACKKINKQTNISEEEQYNIAADATEIIFSNSNSSSRARTKSKKYFGSEWTT